MDAPLFVISSGRAGSTIFHRILCDHPKIAWITALADRYPRRGGIQRAVLRGVDLPAVGPLLSRLHPDECYDFWEHLVPGFRRPCRDLVATDVTERNRGRVRGALEAIPTSRRPVLSLKLTGWPRIGFLAEIFPEARFVHVIRDGRSVANSFLNVPWWLGWRGPENWRWGALSEAHREEWERHDRSFVALAALQWKIYLEAYDAATAGLDGGRLLEVRYEDLCREKERIYSEVLAFAGLDGDPRFQCRLAGYALESADEKWRQHLSERQRGILEAVLEAELVRRGYPS